MPIVPGIAAFAAVLLARLQVRQIFLSLFRLPPYPPVEEAHDCDGHVEGGNRRAERDVMICLDELNVALVVRHRALTLNIGPAVDPRRPKQQTYPPSRPEACK